MRASIFITCLTDTLFPETGRAMVALLERLGMQLDFPREQTCCRQMHYNTGYVRETLPLVRRFVRVFDRLGRSLEHLIDLHRATFSYSCTKDLCRLGRRRLVTLQPRLEASLVEPAVYLGHLVVSEESSHILPSSPTTPLCLSNSQQSALMLPLVAKKKNTGSQGRSDISGYGSTDLLYALARARVTDPGHVGRSGVTSVV